jgi:hypothetical protein
MKLDRKKQRLVNSALNSTVQRKLGNFLKARIILPAHSEWVSNWMFVSKTVGCIRTCFSSRTFSQAIMRNPFPPLNIRIILQRVVESQLKPLLDEIQGYNKIKVKGANVYKTTFITN